jgi:hypothetical protein
VGSVSLIMVSRFGGSTQQGIGERRSGQADGGQLDEATAAILRNVISHGSSPQQFL